MGNIKSWLESHRLEKYADLFIENEIDLDILDDLTMDELKELDIPLGARKRILKAIAAGGEDSLSTKAVGSTPSAASGREAERRQLTVMFCDLAGSTALSESMDPEDYREVISAYQTGASRVVAEHDGYLARFMGDGLLIYFGYPQAQENDPERAARAGLAIVEAVGALPFSPELAVRVGIATGPVVVGDIIGEGASEEVAVLGETPNLAARLQAAAAPNSVLLAPATQRLLRGSVETQALAAVDLKGLSEPIVPHRALRPRSLSEVSSARFDTSPLVGREVEVALLERAWLHAQSGEGQVILLRGEAGVGKSRLLRAFQDSINAEERRRVQWHCTPYHQNTANYPSVEQIKRSIAFDDADAVASVERLRAMVTSLGLKTQQVVPMLAWFLSIPVGDAYTTPESSPEELKLRALAVQVDLLLAAAKQAPVLFILEDLHWADPSTLEVLGEMASAIEDSRVLILMTARPEFEPPWDAQSNSIVHGLNSLTKSETRTLVQRLAEQQGLTTEMVEGIVERSDGVPLFIEEVTKNLLESSGSVGVPASLQDSLMARLDRLGASKELAQMASVIGRSFALDTLVALTGWPRAAIEQGLTLLADAGLVRRRTSGEYEFKHALVRDAAYDSMLRNPLRKHHARFAEHLKVSGVGERQPELLAQHYTEAGDDEQAIALWILAGDRALAHAAQSEAAAHFGRALALLDGLEESTRRPTDELSVLLRLGQAQFGALGGAAPQTIKIYTRAAKLAKDFGTVADMCQAQYGHWVGLMISGRTLESVDVAREINRLSVESGDRWSQAVSDRLRGAAHYLTGQLDEARKLLLQVLLAREVLEQGPRGFGHDPYFTAAPTLAVVEWTLGFPQEAIKRSERNLAELDAVAMNPNTMSYALVWHMLLTLFSRRQTLLLEVVGALEEHTRRSGGIFWGAMCDWGKGAHLIRSGKAHEGLKVLERGYREFVATGALQVVPFARLLEAEGHIATGDLQRCLTTLTAAEELATQTAQLVYLPEVHRLRGVALALKGEPVSAGASFRCALDIARTHNAKSFELRAATSLADFWRGMGKHGEALSLLLPIYNEFGAGDDWPDVHDAKCLIEQLKQN